MKYLAQINIAQMLHPIDSHEMKDFVDNLERVNALADAAPGFVWRLKGENENATAYRVFGEDKLINMSIWEDFDSLKNYVYKSPHVAIMIRKKEWFAKPEMPHMALWWIPSGHIPDPEEGKERLEYLWQQGPTPQAFTFRKFFPAPEK